MFEEASTTPCTFILVFTSRRPAVVNELWRYMVLNVVNLPPTVSDPCMLIGPVTEADERVDTGCPKDILDNMAIFDVFEREFTTNVLLVDPTLLTKSGPRLVAFCAKKVFVDAMFVLILEPIVILDV